MLLQHTHKDITSFSIEFYSLHALALSALHNPRRSTTLVPDVPRITDCDKIFI